MPKLLLHAGMPKTGTSSIQTNLSRYDWENFLGVQQISYLKAPCIDSNHSEYLNALSGKPHWKTAMQHRQTVKLFSDELDRATSNAEPLSSILVSAESVSAIARNMRHLELLEKFISRYFSRVRVIVYVREPLSYMYSRIHQALKSAYPMGESVIQNAIDTADCALFLANLRRIFGDANVSIRSYDPGILEGGDIVTDFCLGALALPDSAQLRKQLENCVDSNLSQPPEVIELLVRLYEQKQITPQTLHTDQAFFQILDTMHRKSDSGSATELFSPAVRQRISTVADKLRARTRDYLGYDCFPSYQPVDHSPPGDIGSGQNSIQVFHSVSAILERHLIEYGENYSDSCIQYAEGGAREYGRTREEAKSRAYQLLESLYEQCNQQ